MGEVAADVKHENNLTETVAAQRQNPVNVTRSEL
jgi:hypothetical protein